MRVITGSLGGRLFDSPGTDRTHPMSDKIRGALFNILGDLDGLTILDAFGGSGALSFEAISRGAVSAVILESDRTAQKTIQHNIHALGVTKYITLISIATGTWLDREKDKTFDVVLCDPPYDQLQPALLKRLTRSVKPGGVFVLSYPASEPTPQFDHMQPIKQQSYGDAYLVFYRA
jgi:16S rRNA (guanine966-N2)-methyltransferase